MPSPSTPSPERGAIRRVVCAVREAQDTHNVMAVMLSANTDAALDALAALEAELDEAVHRVKQNSQQFANLAKLRELEAENATLRAALDVASDPVSGDTALLDSFDVLREPEVGVNYSDPDQPVQELLGYMWRVEGPFNDIRSALRAKIEYETERAARPPKEQSDDDLPF